MITTGVVRHGAVEVEAGVLPEGARATVLIPEGDETFEASPEEEAKLVAALAAAKRGETVPASEVLDLLRKR
ncbi:MAG: hypothetical protein ABIV06_08725 [Thermoanaerobaculia bacterium]